MFKQLRSLIFKGPPVGNGAAPKPTMIEFPTKVSAEGVKDFDVSSNIDDDQGFPFLDWQVAHAWVESIPDVNGRAEAWSRLERAWLQHMKAVLGVEYSLRESGDAMLLSTLDPNVADATLSYMAKTLERIVRILNGIATAAEWGKDILIVFEDEEAYYRYVSHFYPSDGAFAFSSGMHIAGGCGHFVTTKADLRAIEPIIAHEMTHSCLSHLPIPAWLNEGLAVNTEHRLVPPPRPSISPQQMHVMHRAFWGDVEIQQFWSGKSFLRPDNGTMLSYELARILVAQLSGDWPTFCAFVRDANLQDSGAAAALSHLHMDLGVAVGALLERESGVAWRLDPETWDEQPERGAF